MISAFPLTQSDLAYGISQSGECECFLSHYSWFRTIVNIGLPQRVDLLTSSSSTLSEELWILIIHHLSCAVQWMINKDQEDLGSCCSSFCLLRILVGNLILILLLFLMVHCQKKLAFLWACLLFLPLRGKAIHCPLGPSQWIMPPPSGSSLEIYWENAKMNQG